MSVPSVLERCRMALAEIGLSPDLARTVDGRVRVSRAIGIEQGWMLHCTAAKPVLCLPCFRALADAQLRAIPDDRPALTGAAREACGAWRPFQRESCGATQ